MYINNPFGPLYKKPHRARGTDMTGKVNVGSGTENTQDRSSGAIPKTQQIYPTKRRRNKKTRRKRTPNRS